MFSVANRLQAEAESFRERALAEGDPFADAAAKNESDEGEVFPDGEADATAGKQSDTAESVQRPARSRWQNDSDESEDEFEAAGGGPTVRPPTPGPTDAAQHIDSDSDGERADSNSRPPSCYRHDSGDEEGQTVTPGSAGESGLHDVSSAVAEFLGGTSFTGLPMPGGKPCRSVDCYEKLHKIDEGTYGVVYKARDKITGDIVALKQVKLINQKEGFPVTALREINVLLSLQHPNIVNVREMVVGNNHDKIFMVMDFMEHDLKGLMMTMKQPFTASEVKRLMLDLTSAIEYCHEHWVLHRDLKTSNLLLSNEGIVALCDFGLARKYGDPLKEYTQLVVTLWYRAPELLLGSKIYGAGIDMWSLGCIFAELVLQAPLLPGKGELDQIDKIFKLLGVPTESSWPGVSELPHMRKVNFKPQPFNHLKEKFRRGHSFTSETALSDAGLDLLTSMLCLDPNKRITAKDALAHAYFSEQPMPKAHHLMPTWPSTHEGKGKPKVRSADAEDELQRLALFHNR